MTTGMNVSMEIGLVLHLKLTIEMSSQDTVRGRVVIAMGQHCVKFEVSLSFHGSLGLALGEH